MNDKPQGFIGGAVAAWNSGDTPPPPDLLRAENDALKLRVGVLEKALAEGNPQAQWILHERDFPELRLLSVERVAFDGGPVRTVVTFARESQPERPLVQAVIDDAHGLTASLRERLRR